MEWIALVTVEIMWVNFPRLAYSEVYFYRNAGHTSPLSLPPKADKIWDYIIHPKPQSWLFPCQNPGNSDVKLGNPQFAAEGGSRIIQFNKLSIYNHHLLPWRKLVRVPEKLKFCQDAINKNPSVRYTFKKKLENVTKWRRVLNSTPPSPIVMPPCVSQFIDTENSEKKHILARKPFLLWPPIELHQKHQYRVSPNMLSTWSSVITEGREIEVLVTWTNNFIKMAANTQETILFTFQWYFCQMYKNLTSQTFALFPIFVLSLKISCNYLSLYCQPNSSSLWISVPILILALKKLKAKLAFVWQTQSMS